MELEKANEHLRELGRQKDEFFAKISHELRTPITNIKLHHELIALQPERADEFLETLSRETDRLSYLIERILMLSRFDQGITKHEPSVFDLGALVQEYVADRRALAESKGLSLNVRSDLSDPVVYADRDLIGQVLSILLTNALEYTPAAGIVYIRLHERYNGIQKWIGFSVKDSGKGISLEDQEHLFTRFFRGSVGRKSGVSGSGLGLAIAREIVGRHGGRIDVVSRGIPGEGTTFHVWLPKGEQ
ncbi:MAG: HAMP domain-containing histidine kinase [Chloroflexi bacterium]|nr:HAMP domain-containing histidine kinase [Chloroflexota bacterium]